MSQSSSSSSPGLVYRASSHQAQLVSRLGVVGYLRFRLHQLRSRKGGRGFVSKLSAKSARYAVYARGRSSDFDAFNDIFVHGQYDLPLDEPAWFVDCGANTGFATCLMLSRFPNCRALAIEAEGDNFRMLQRNLKPFGDRAIAMHAAVWSHQTQLAISTDVYRDGRDWSRQVGPVTAGQPTVPAFDVPTLFARHGVSGRVLVKMDIEGAEAVVLQNGPLDWLDAVDTLLIELHDDTVFGSGTASLKQAMAGRPFEVSTNGETTVCRRRR
ncbi:MAG: FkbM family methyltransferase [Tepidisphaeraceae bacterium]